jgi:sugar O-acyltransferase (sialic acid O-acetyltransferase NeuD family)
VSGWALYGCRTSYALEVAETIWRRGEDLALLVDNLPADHEAELDGTLAAAGVPLRASAELRDGDFSLDVAVPLITPGHRFALEAEARSFGFASFPALLDPTATLARTARVEDGSILNAAVVVAGAAHLGRFVHVNRSCSVGHHNRIGDFASLGPGCVLAGQVTVGRGAFLGAGAVCAPRVTVGANAIVGAGAVVVGDVPPGAVVVGNPAQLLPGKEGGYGGTRVPE